MSEEGGERGNPVAAWIASPAGSPLDRIWEPAPDLDPFDAFYTAVLRHSRVHPADALTAIDHLDPGRRARLEPVDRLRWHRLRGHACLGLGRIDESCREYRTAWEGFVEIGRKEEAGTTGIGFAAALGHAGRIVDALAIVREAMTFLDRGDRRRRARLLSNEGNLLFLTGQYDEAIRCYRRAARFLEAEKLPLDVALARYNLGHTQLYRGDTRAARAAFDEILPAFRRAHHRSQEVYVEFSYAIADVLDGRWEGVLLRLRDLEEEMTELGDLRVAANMGKESAEILLRIGATSPAERAAERSLAVYRRLGLHRNVAHVSFLQGRALLRLGRHLEAAARFEESRDLLAGLGDAWARRRVELELAGVRIRLGRPAEALTMLRGALDSARGRGERVLWFRVLQLQAEAQLRAGDARRALPLARRAHRAAHAPLLQPERPALALTCAEAAAATGRTDLARSWIRRALTEQLSLGSRTSSEVAVTGETDGQREFRERMFRLALDAYGPKRADRVLQLVLRALPDPARERGAPARRGRRDELASTMTALRDELLGVTDGRDQAVRYRELEARLAEALRSESSPAPATREAADADRENGWRSRLGDRRLVVFLVDDARRKDATWYAFVADPGGKTRVVRLPDATATLRARWIPVRLALEQAAHLPPAARLRLLESTRRESKRALEELRRAFWEPLELAPGRVVILPDAPAQGLPLESLPLTDDASDPERYVVSRIPHPGFLAPARRSARRRRTSPALVLHDGGDGTRAEAAQVRSALRRGGLPARVDSRRRALQSEEARLGALHVAAHGVYHREQWLLNGIRLRDGWMGMESLAVSRLRDALLFFSSCESGLQHDAPGGQIGGWTEAGLRAGAREILLALWKIPDDYASLFAREFYARWTAGMRADAAASHARAVVRGQQDHPFAWASFLTCSRE